MNYRYSRWHLFFIGSTALFLSTLYNVCAKNSNQQKKSLPVRVLLASFDLGSHAPCSLIIPAGYELWEKTKKKVVQKTDSPELFIKIRPDSFAVNERKIVTGYPLIIKPNHHEFVFEGHTYQ